MSRHHHPQPQPPQQKVSLLDAIRQRESQYALSDDVATLTTVTRIHDIVREGVTHTPTPINCRSGRAVVLLRREHRRFWDLAREAARAAVPRRVFDEAFAPRFESFRAAYGTILFYESQNAIDKAVGQIPMIKDKMPQWSEHANGMLQYAIWTMLCAEGLGVNLQHYSPLVDAPAARQWDIPADWSLKAQMVFGKPAAPPAGAAPKRAPDPPLEESRIRIFGAVGR
ncbi:nitroreductase [Xylariaceae sp. FL0804]|nr:nitroreductase [Xylariaceae sp. FL0804]